MVEVEQHLRNRSKEQLQVLELLAHPPEGPQQVEVSPAATASPAGAVSPGGGASPEAGPSAATSGAGSPTFWSRFFTRANIISWELSTFW